MGEKGFVVADFADESAIRINKNQRKFSFFGAAFFDVKNLLAAGNVELIKLHLIPLPHFEFQGELK